MRRMSHGSPEEQHMAAIAQLEATQAIVRVVAQLNMQLNAPRDELRGECVRVGAVDESIPGRPWMPLTIGQWQDIGSHCRGNKLRPWMPLTIGQWQDIGSHCLGNAARTAA